MKKTILIEAGEQIEDEDSYGYICIENPEENKPSILIKRRYGVSSICFHDSKLYDAEEDGAIVSTLDFIIRGHTVFSHGFNFMSKGTPSMLISHNGRLFSGNSKGNFYHPTDKGRIYDLTNRKIVGERPDGVLDLCVFDEKLIDAGSYGIFDALIGKELFTSQIENITKLHVYKNTLYAASGNNIIDVIANKIIAKRRSEISAFCEFKGDLYDGCIDGSVYKTLDEEIVNKFEYCIYALCSHDDNLIASVPERIYNVLTSKLVSESYWWHSCYLLSVPSDIIRPKLNFTEEARRILAL